MIWLGSEDEPERNLVAPEVGSNEPSARSESTAYQQQGEGIVRCQQLANGHTKLIPVCNFTARIVRDILWDDELETRREFALEAQVAGQRISLVVPAGEFSRMRWVPRQLGPRAIVSPGQLSHAGVAIQSLSEAISVERIFTHLGWRKLGFEWVYLQCGGAIAAHGRCSDSQVDLPAALRHYETPLPGDRSELRKAIRSSLAFQSVAPDRITLPLLAAVYRAPLGGVDFSVFLTGRTGTFKTALATLCQQHFGAAMSANLPASFASTANALEELCFCAKDALIVVDDFVPIGGSGDNQLRDLAERLFRGAGNHQGRTRVTGHGLLHAARPPRALVLATDEEVPSGQSLRARLLIVEVRQGDVDYRSLTGCQRAGSDGQFAASMGAYLAWMAGRYEEVQRMLKKRVHDLRNRLHEQAGSVHARLPTTMAELQSGWEIWLEFASEVGAITAKEKQDLKRRNWQALTELTAVQQSCQQPSNPAFRFLSLVQLALVTGHAHVASQTGQAPDGAERWGWRRNKLGIRWAPKGTRIGWIKQNDVFLEPTISLQVAQQLAGAQQLPITAQTLRYRLREHGLLASIDTGRQMLLVRRTLEGTPKQVLHLRASDFVNPAGASA